MRNRNDLSAQCMGAMDYMADVLGDLGAELSDLTRLVVYFVGGEVEEATILERICARIGADTAPCLSTIALDELCYPDMLIEIEGVAMRSENGSKLPRQRIRDDRLPKLAAGYSHVVHCADMVFVSDMSSIQSDGEVDHPGDIIGQSQTMMEQLVFALSLAGAKETDLVKLNTFYRGDGAAEDWARAAKVRIGYLSEPGPAATGIPLPRFSQAGLVTKIAATAMIGQDGSSIAKRYSWPNGHWDWPTHLPFKHANKTGRMIHVGGQVSMDSAANVLDGGDMVAQTVTSMDNIRAVLTEFGATLDDVVKVTTFYQGQASADELHENLCIRSDSYKALGPATTGIPVPALAYEGMVIEIEVIAMVPE